jgi:hypothetical protein
VVTLSPQGEAAQAGLGRVAPGAKAASRAAPAEGRQVGSRQEVTAEPQAATEVPGEAVGEDSAAAPGEAAKAAAQATTPRQ